MEHEKDNLPKITIPLALYNELVKDSEKLAVLGRMVAKNSYIPNEELKTILDIKESGVQHEPVSN